MIIGRVLIVGAVKWSITLNVFPSISLNLILWSSAIWKKFNSLSFIFGNKPEKSSFHWVKTEAFHQMLSMLGSVSISKVYSGRTYIPKTDLQYPGTDRFYYIVICLQAYFSILSFIPH